jgi:dTDP-4-dehydrorhamnose 3,5-epimerase
MDVVTTPLPGLLVLKPYRIEDPRGFLCETYHRRRLAEAGIDADFVQDNLSLSRPMGTLRGLHFQRPPMAQAKLVSVLKGAARDVVVDLRRSSPTFGRHFAVELSEEAGLQLFVPIGLAHGFVTTKPDTLFAYKASSYYSPSHDAGIRFDDPQLGIDWGQSPDALILSERDLALPRFHPKMEYFA